MDLYLYLNQNAGSTADLQEIAVFPNFNKKTLAPALVLPVSDKASTPYYYWVKLKDRATGNFVTDARLTDTWSMERQRPAGLEWQKSDLLPEPGRLPGQEKNHRYRDFALRVYHQTIVRMTKAGSIA